MSQVPGSSRDQAAPTAEPYVVVSIDSHVGPSVQHQLRDYCEEKYLPDFDRFAAEMQGKGSVLRTAAAESDSGETFSLGAASPEMIEEFGRLAGIRSPGEHPTSSLQRSYENSLVAGHLQDPAAREADMDVQGVAADVI